MKIIFGEERPFFKDEVREEAASTARFEGLKERRLSFGVHPQIWWSPRHVPGDNRQLRSSYRRGPSYRDGLPQTHRAGHRLLGNTIKSPVSDNNRLERRSFASHPTGEY